jgi:hypothetical protein
MSVSSGSEQAKVEAPSVSSRQQVSAACASCQIVGLAPDCCVFNEHFEDWFPEATSRCAKCGGCDITTSVCLTYESCLGIDRFEGDGGPQAGVVSGDANRVSRTICPFLESMAGFGDWEDR